MDIIKSLKWRYSVKKFDNKKKISKEQLDGIINAINLSASSYGIQPYKIIIVSNPIIKKKLFEKSFYQNQIIDCSHLIIFASFTNFSKKYIDETIDYIIKKRSLNPNSLDNLKNNIFNNIKSFSIAERINWAAKQSYIALGTLLTYCALKKIDTCPMEGFLKKSFDKILNLSSKNIGTSVLAAVGYRSLDDKLQYFKKVRKPLSKMVIYF